MENGSRTHYYYTNIQKSATIQSRLYFSSCLLPHQLRSGSSFKAGRGEVPGSIPGGACRPTCSEFFVVLSETCVNTGQDPLKSPPPPRTFPYSPRTIVQSNGLNVYNITQSNLMFTFFYPFRYFFFNLHTINFKQIDVEP